MRGNGSGDLLLHGGQRGEAILLDRGGDLLRK